jgi:DNA-binding XRE family transcriptional regulator
VNLKLTNDSVGRRLAVIRIDRGLTQRELAAALGVSRQTVCHWETSGHCAVDIDDARRCGRVLRCRHRSAIRCRPPH